ncbi:MAG: hypothetical protein BSOLF_0065 [Candidatus Carbobacillus altaicus]|uniref:Uncharacterized protein n=1 Tax=Candidatus Carbonibacillus altaicus TaxID=2163959 RepID=A0A2R6XXK9_9BACL|nr:MAG: hypothetical protein BSOLF_0065 [Candidatus Carbobacillus altaicus]
MPLKSLAFSGGRIMDIPPPMGGPPGLDEPNPGRLTPSSLRPSSSKTR